MIRGLGSPTNNNENRSNEKLVRFSFLAHPNRRLMRELIVYPCYGVVVHNVKNISETSCPTKAKFYAEPPWVGGTRVCSRHLGRMIWFTLPRWTPRVNMVKPLQKSSAPEPVDRFPRNLVCSIGHSCPFVQMMTLG